MPDQNNFETSDASSSANVQTPNQNAQQIQNGQAPYQNGQQVQNGQAPYQNGQTPYRNGQTPYQNGQTPYQNGQTPYRNGQAPYPNGQTPYRNGQTPYPNGQTPYRNGQQGYNNGQTPYPNNSSGQRPMNGQYGSYNARPSTGGYGNGNGGSRGPSTILLVVLAALIAGVLLAIIYFVITDKKSENSSSASSVSVSSEVKEDSASKEASSAAETAAAKSTSAESAASGSKEDAEKASASISVPDVVGMPKDSAQKALEALGLKVSVEEMESSDTEAGFVISQNPTAEKKAASGDTVTLYVAKASASQQASSSTTTQQQTTTAQTYTMYVAANEYVTLRQSPSTSASALTTISHGQVLTCYETSGDFTKCSYNGQTGYVLTAYISADPNMIVYGDGKTASGSSTTTSSSNIWYCRASDYVTLRSYASRDAGAITTINTGETVTYISTSGEWFYVEYAGAKGYVLKKFFSQDPNGALVYDER